MIKKLFNQFFVNNVKSKLKIADILVFDLIFKYTTKKDVDIYKISKLDLDHAISIEWNKLHADLDKSGLTNNQLKSIQKIILERLTSHYSFWVESTKSNYYLGKRDE